MAKKREPFDYSSLDFASQIKLKHIADQVSGHRREILKARMEQAQALSEMMPLAIKMWRQDEFDVVFSDILISALEDFLDTLEITRHFIRTEDIDGIEEERD